MDEDRIKKAVLGAIERSVDAHELAEVVRALARGPRATHPDDAAEIAAGATPGAQRLLTRIVLGDILDDTILSARPQDRTFPLRLFFGELGRILAADETDGDAAATADAAFTLASGLNFFFRARMDAEGKMRVGLEVSRQLYAFAHVAHLDRELVAKATPLLAALMTNDLERVKFESVDHIKLFDSEVHERVDGSDPTAFNVVRPASFLCRVASNSAVKAKAAVFT